MPSKFGGIPVEQERPRVSRFGGEITDYQKPFSVAAFSPEKALPAEAVVPRVEGITPEQRELAEETAQGVGGFLRTGAISTGRGLARLARALNIMEPETEAEEQAFKALEEERPRTVLIGEAIGEAAPFAGIPIGTIVSTPARVAAAAGLGAVEGGLISRGRGEGEIQQLKSAGIGGTIAGGIEAAIPIIGRIGGKIIRKALGKTPKSTILTPDGLPTQEFSQALDKMGLTFDDIQESAIELSIKSPNIEPEQALRQALFKELDIPATKGDILPPSKAFEQQALEARLFESAADPLAEPIRTRRLEQSEAITQNINTLIEKAGIPENVGNSIKEALSGRRAILKSKKNALYRQAAKSAENPSALPFPVDAIQESMPDARTLREISTFEPQKTEALLDLLAEFGIDKSKEAIERLRRKKIQEIPLSVENFDTFRKSLNRLMETGPGQPEHMAVIAGPIKRALDNEADNIFEIFEKAGIGQDVLTPLKEARNTVTQLKTEFSPESITGKLIGVKRDRVTPVIEASKVYKNIVGTNQPIELLDRTIKSLKKAGPEGVKAIGDLQAATVLDLMESAFKAEGRKVQGAKIFGAIPFTKRINQIGEEKLKLIFSTKPQLLKDLKKIKSVAETITPPSGALPKGSASVILDSMNRLGLMTILGKVPGGGLLAEGMTRLSEGQATRAATKKALEAKPELQKALTILESEAPALSVALGLTVLREEKQGE